MHFGARGRECHRQRYRQQQRHDGRRDDLDDNGPYADESSGMFFIGGSSLNNLRDEIERMNLVRRCRIQCVGIGEAQMGWLRPIAVKTGGKAVYFGKEGEREANPGGIPGFPKDD